MWSLGLGMGLMAAWASMGMAWQHGPVGRLGLGTGHPWDMPTVVLDHWSRDALAWGDAGRK